MRLVRRFVLTALALLATALTASDAAAHGSAGTASQGYGMLTYTASAQLASPADSTTYIVNPIVFESSVDHFVRVTGPAGQGNPSVDYNMYLYFNTNEFAKVEVLNGTAMIHATGMWTEPAGLRVERSDLANGTNRIAKATAQLRQDDSDAWATAEHQHTFAINIQ